MARWYVFRPTKLHSLVGMCSLILPYFTISFRLTEEGDDSVAAAFSATTKIYYDKQDIGHFEKHHNTLKLRFV